MHRNVFLYGSRVYAKDSFRSIAHYAGVFVKKWVRVFLLLAFVGGGVRGTFAADNPYGLSPDVNRQLLDAFDELFNENFDRADELLRALDQKMHDRPLILTALVIRSWWEMSLHVAETYEEDSQPFLKAAERCLEISERALHNKRLRTEASLSLGTTLGLMSRWSAANRAWLPAFTRGTKAAEHCERVLATNPEIKDALMTIGVFSYAKDMLRKSLPVSDVVAGSTTPTSSEGIEQLRRAYEQGHFFKKPAGLLLAGLLTNEKPEQALPVLDELHQLLPRSAFVHVVRITAYYNTGRLKEMEDDIHDMDQFVSEGVYPPTYTTQVEFMRGLLLFRKAKWKDATQQFNVAIRSNNEKNPYVIWSHLYKGYAMDALGRREDALRQYQKVLEYPRRFSSHDHARDRMNKPFLRTDIEMRKLEL